ncbi:hypothetical protein PBI_SCTP2_131 [Salicola phage SCTP-2]|nr:hypothetical protein PBI_SCTP2_131 [Salicola phage SCTP-2]
MINSRFNGVLRTTVPDTGQNESRRVLILSPYIQTSEQDIDYQKALVVDLQTQENEVVAQIEEMMKSEQANSSKTFLEYSQFSQFKNGENVMKWLHDHNAIQQVAVDDVDIVMNGQHMNLRQINEEIARQNGHSMNTSQQSATSIASEFSDSSMNANNTHPALIEGGPRDDGHGQTSSQLNEQATTSTSSIMGVDSSREQEAVQALQEEAPINPHMENNDSTVDRKEFLENMENLNKRLDEMEKKLKNSSNKETVMLRMAKRYDMTESEIVKALESAGERKQKREQKKANESKNQQKQ